MSNTKTKTQPAPDSTLGMSQLETLTGLGERRIRQLADLGKIPKPDNGRWPAAKTIRGLFDFYRSRREPDALTEARLKKLEAEASIATMKADEKRRELLKRDAVQRTWTGLCIEARQIITNSEKLSLAEKAALQQKFREIPIHKYCGEDTPPPLNQKGKEHVTTDTEPSKGSPESATDV